MTAISVNNGAITFTPKSGDSYFYESFSCQQALSNGYGGIQFNVRGPTGGSVAVELQSSANCSTAAQYNSSYNVVTGLTGGNDLVQLPWEGFDNSPSTDSVVGFSWAEFVGDGPWTMANISLVCGSISTPSQTSTSICPA